MPATADSQFSLSANTGSSSHGSRKPGVWAPCPGATMISTPLLSRNFEGDDASATHEKERLDFVGNLQTRRVESADAEREPEHEGVPRVGRTQPGHVQRTLQSVAHGVRVHEQRAGGRL